MARILSVVGRLGDHAYPQAEITAAIAPLISPEPATQAIVSRLHEACGVRQRHLVMPLEWYDDDRTFGQSNGLFIERAAELARSALEDALARAGADVGDVDCLHFTSVTGISAPSIDALLVPRMGLRRDLKRVPMYGLGCVGGAAGIARVADYLAGHPDDIAVLVSVELCSLTFQRGDDSMGNIVASGLFGDGAAAIVMAGERRARRLGLAGPEVVATRSSLYPDSEGVIGFTVGAAGFSVVLTAQVAGLIERHLGEDVRRFLGDNGLSIAELDEWIAHPGGPRVLQAFQHSLELPEGALAASWRSLADRGNLSSASVLHILAETMERPAGTTGLLFALGPGVAAELVLLRWPGEQGGSPGGNGWPGISR